jgi:hypothetical protein
VLILGIQHSHQFTHEALLDLEARYGKDICIVMVAPTMCSMEEIAYRKQEREEALLFQLSALPIAHEIKLDLPREPRLDPQAKKFHLHQTPPTQKKLGKPSK